MTVSTQGLPAGGFAACAGSPPRGAAGADLGLTLAKVAVATEGGFDVRWARPSEFDAGQLSGAPSAGVTGARAAAAAERGLTVVPEIDAGARGAVTLLGEGADGFVLALLGTGTAFAAVRDGQAQHLGGAAIGGGSFAGIARRLAPGMSHPELLAAAARGDRRKADVMVADAYPEGVGRIAPDLTAAHLAKQEDALLDDVLASLMNLHGETIGQIAASRARIAGTGRIVLAGGFAHENPTLVTSITAMASLFNVTAEVIPSPAFAGAIGAALIAAETAGERSSA
jgi:type II pantothenate kinase